MLVQHFQANRQIPGSNTLVFISSCHCCVFEMYLECFSIPLSNPVLHGNQKSNNELKSGKFEMQSCPRGKNPGCLCITTVSLKTLKLVFLIMGKIYPLIIERINLLINFGYLLFSISMGFHCKF